MRQISDSQSLAQPSPHRGFLGVSARFYTLPLPPLILDLPVSSHQPLSQTPTHPTTHIQLRVMQVDTTTVSRNI